MVKRPMDTPSSPAAGLDISARASQAGVPPKSGSNGGDEPGPILQAGWRLFGSLSRGQTILILAIGAWLVLALVALGVFGLLG